MRYRTKVQLITVCIAAAMMGTVLLNAPVSSKSMAQDKSKTPSEAWNADALEKFLKNTLLTPTTLDKGKYEIVVTKKTDTIVWTIPCVVSLSGDGTSLILSSRWSAIPGPTTIPPEIAFKILLANNAIYPATIAIENGALCMKRAVNNQGLTPEVFRKIYDELVDTIMSNVGLLSGWEWNIPNQLFRMGRGGTAVRSLAVFPNGKRIVVGKPIADEAVRIWELEAGRDPIELVKPSGGAWALAVSPGGKNVFVGSAGGALLEVDVDSKKTVKTFEGHKHYVWSLALSADGKQLFSSGGAFKQDGKPVDKDNRPTETPDWSIRVWDVESGKEIKKFEGHAGFIQSVALSPSGNLLVSASDDLSVRIWDVKSGKELKRLPIPPSGANSAVFRSESQVVIGERGPSIRVYDVETSKEVKSFVANPVAVFRLAVSSDGKRVLSCGPDGTVRLWDIDTGTSLAAFGGHLAAIGNIAFTPDEHAAVSGSYDGSARVWQLPK
jgi:WD40 repeat protein